MVHVMKITNFQVAVDVLEPALLVDLSVVLQKFSPHSVMPAPEDDLKRFYADILIQCTVTIDAEMRQFFCRL